MLAADDVGTASTFGAGAPGASTTHTNLRRSFIDVHLQSTKVGSFEQVSTRVLLILVVIVDRPSCDVAKCPL